MGRPSEERGSQKTCLMTIREPVRGHTGGPTWDEVNQGAIPRAKSSRDIFFAGGGEYEKGDNSVCDRRAG
jgi:hypothetical protein